MINKIERRAVADQLESSGNQLVGYASVYNSLSEDLGKFFERIAPSAFEKTLSTKSDVRALINHDSNLVLGRTSNGTLRLSTDDRGLRVEIDPPDTSYFRDLKELIKRGDVNQMSIGFFVKAEDWAVENSVRVRTVTDVELLEVSIVTIPAYADTSIALRSSKVWELRRLMSVKDRERKFQLSQLCCRRDVP